MTRTRPSPALPLPYIHSSTPITPHSTPIKSAIVNPARLSFYALRVYRVIPKPYAYLGALCILISSTRFIGSIVLAIAAGTAKSIAIYRVQWKWLIITLLSLGTVVDGIIAVSMVYYLYIRRSHALGSLNAREEFRSDSSHSASVERYRSGGTHGRRETGVNVGGLGSRIDVSMGFLFYWWFFVIFCAFLCFFVLFCDFWG
ncbi:hypothetical protein CVT24_012162 [Panaeolus cyanescens]|uniref:Uncharacterized protein n=1 Tax=Panaeolus cyanescens TaxID=181874 RepID=A0A409YIY0_9AGAR|nr:hypothetical protein CVT24_012162 [Panaeolus cyanescens]